MIHRLVVVSLTGSIASILWMWIGGLITYAPNAVTPNEMQNIYLSRILWYGLLSGVLQIVAIGLTIAGRRANTLQKDVVEQR